MFIRFTIPVLCLLLLACESPSAGSLQPLQPAPQGPAPSADATAQASASPGLPGGQTESQPSAAPVPGPPADIQLAHPEGMYNGNLTPWRGQPQDQTLYFLVEGARDGGSVWGTEIYTDDSHLPMAAVHAGLLAPAETGIVAVQILPGQAAYSGSSYGGIQSRDYGAWEGSFRFVGALAEKPAAIANPGNLIAYRDQVGLQLRIELLATAEGTVWGSGVYTDDSSLATAAVHAGLLQPGEQGIVTLEVLPGLASYGGESRNGVTSRDYGAWHGSFRFVGLAENIRRP